MSLFDIPVDRRGTNSVKWSGLPGNEVIPMCIADMDFLAPVACYRGAASACGRMACSAIPACPIPCWRPLSPGWRGGMSFADYCRALAGAEYRRRHLVAQRDPRLHAGRRWDHHPDPLVYHPFFSVIRQSRRVVVENPLRLVQGRYQMDFELLEEQASQAKLLISASPHNPVGRVWTRGRINPAWGRSACATGCIVVSDEIHCDITFNAAPLHPLPRCTKSLPGRASPACRRVKPLTLPG